MASYRPMFTNSAPSRVHDEAMIHTRLEKSLKTPKHFGNTGNDVTAAHVRKLVETVQELAQNLEEEWSHCQTKNDLELQRFMNNQAKAQVAFRELRVTMTALADLVQCSQRKYYSMRNQQVQGMAPVHVTSSVATLPYIFPSSSQATTTAEVKEEPQNDADYGIKKEIKEEDEDPIEEPISDVFVPHFDRNVPDRVPKVEQPEPEDYVEASLSLGIFNNPPSLPNIMKRKTVTMVPNNILPFVCHLCNSYNPQAKYSATPRDPEERRQFLLNLRCVTQEEKNKREVLLLSTRHVYFCGRHVPHGAAERVPAADMVHNNQMKKQRLQQLERTGVPSRARRPPNPNDTSTPSTSYRLLFVKPPTE